MHPPRARIICDVTKKPPPTHPPNRPVTKPSKTAGEFNFKKTSDHVTITTNITTTTRHNDRVPISPPSPPHLALDCEKNPTELAPPQAQTRGLGIRRLMERNAKRAPIKARRLTRTTTYEPVPTEQPGLGQDERLYVVVAVVVVLEGNSHITRFWSDDSLAKGRTAGSRFEKRNEHA